MLKYRATPCLERRRKEAGLTQIQLAELSGVPQGTISAFDKRSRHEDWILFALARALNLASIEELFDVELVDANK